MKSRLDHHRHKLLKQKFASVGHPDLAYVFARLAGSAVKLSLTEVCFTKQTAFRANMHSVAVTNVK